MEFQGPTNEYLLLAEATAANHHLLKQRITPLTWMMDNDDTQLKIDGHDHCFRRNEVVCLAEFPRVEVIRATSLRLVRFKRRFFASLTFSRFFRGRQERRQVGFGKNCYFTGKTCLFRRLPLSPPLCHQFTQNFSSKILNDDTLFCSHTRRSKSQ